MRIFQGRSFSLGSSTFCFAVLLFQDGVDRGWGRWCRKAAGHRHKGGVVFNAGLTITCACNDDILFLLTCTQIDVPPCDENLATCP